MSVVWYNLGGVDFLAIRKNGLVIDIACAERCFHLTRRPSYFFKRLPWPFASEKNILPTKVRARDLALYTHWPVHTKEFWELLNIQT